MILFLIVSLYLSLNDTTDSNFILLVFFSKINIKTKKTKRQKKMSFLSLTCFWHQKVIKTLQISHCGQYLISYEWIYIYFVDMIRVTWFFCWFSHQKHDFLAKNELKTLIKYLLKIYYVSITCIYTISNIICNKTS